jgi:hypothetical protein
MRLKKNVITSATLCKHCLSAFPNCISRCTDLLHRDNCEVGVRSLGGIFMDSYSFAPFVKEHPSNSKKYEVAASLSPGRNGVVGPSTHRSESQICGRAHRAGDDGRRRHLVPPQSKIQHRLRLATFRVSGRGLETIKRWSALSYSSDSAYTSTAEEEIQPGGPQKNKTPGFPLVCD